MTRSAAVRRRIVSDCMEGKAADDAGLDELRSLRGRLASIPRSGESDSDAILQLDTGRTITVDLDYEETELQKDICFLTEGEDALTERYLKGSPDLKQQVAQGVEFLKGRSLKNFISDRDGTVNNYCGRYLSSIQSVYNAVFLTRYARARVENACILTSAPLANGGLVDISVAPRGAYYYAGSKGREYVDREGRFGSFEIEPLQQQALDSLNEDIKNILEQSRYAKFGLIGSAFQRKFGQTTIARQDISKSVPEEESAQFLALIEETVQKLDPDGIMFRIEDTGFDVEVILTVAGKGEELKDFDKGDGVRFLDNRLGFGIAGAGNLVCGDTASDVPMVREAVRQSEKTCAIFVTREEQLAASVRDACADSLIVTEPDVLVWILNEAAGNA